MAQRYVIISADDWLFLIYANRMAVRTSLHQTKQGSTKSGVLKNVDQLNKHILSGMVELFVNCLHVLQTRKRLKNNVFNKPFHKNRPESVQTHRFTD